MRAAVLIPLLAVCVSGCASAQAKAAPGAPALEMPPAPPRTVEPIEVEPPPPPLVEEPARNPPRRPPAPSPRPEANKPEPGPPPEPAKPTEEPAKPPTTLQTTPAGKEGEEEQKIRAILSKASADLNRVDYRKLNPEARTQYDSAKRFVLQADNALRAKNLVFAKTVADKAAGLAAQLAGK